MSHGPTSNPCEPVLVEESDSDQPSVRAIRNARWLVLAAALLWSTSGFFVKSPALSGWSGSGLAFWRAVFACLVLWPLVRKPRWEWGLVPMAILFTAMNYTYLTAMVKGTAANAIWLQCTAPVWVLVVGVFFFGERATRLDWLMIVCAAMGIAVILYFESRGVALEAVAWGLASGVFYAGVVLSLRQLRGHDPVWLAAWNHLVTAVALAPLAFAHAKLPSGTQWLFLAGLGIVQMAIPYVLFTRSLQRITGHEAAGIGLIEPLLVPTWAYLAWADRPAPWTLAGGAFILAGLTLRYLVPEKRR